MPVTIGVDPHKTSHTAAALDEHGQLLDRQRFPATLEGHQALHQWAGRWDDRRWAVEGAHGLGRPWPNGWSATASKWWTCRPS
jgi:transposase